MDEKDRDQFQRELSEPLPTGIIRHTRGDPDEVSPTVVAEEMAAFRSLSGQTRQLTGGE